MLVATTETGSKYEIRRGIYRKNMEYTQKVWDMKTPDADFQPRTLRALWDGLDALEPADKPVVGKRLYISRCEEWNFSTPVVRVDEYRSLAPFFIESRAARRA